MNLTGTIVNHCSNAKDSMVLLTKTNIYIVRITKDDVETNIASKEETIVEVCLACVSSQISRFNHGFQEIYKIDHN